MKIKYSNLTISTAENPPKNFSLVQKRTLQTDRAIGLENAIVSDKGNSVFLVSFTVENSRKTPAFAEEFSVDFLQEISSKSPATLEIFFGENENQKSLKIENAIMAKCKASVDGRLATHAFEFTAGTTEE